MTILSPTQLNYFCVGMVLGACILFFCLDSYRLQKAMREPASPLVRDRIFGAVVGLVCAIVGFVGLYLQHWQ